MRKFALISIITIVIPSMGCAIKQAQNNEEFRQIAPTISYGEHKTYDINNSYSKAVKNFKKRAEKCFNKEVILTTTSRTGATIGKQTLAYTPTLKVGKARTELSIQKNVSGTGTIMGKIPEKGMYILLADISKSGEKSKLDIYRLTYMATDEMVNGIKNWATGKSLDCPDLTK